MNPVGHDEHGLIAPFGYVFGTNSCKRLVPLVPRYVAVIVMDPGMSRCTSACQFCAAPTRKFGSTANVFSPTTPGTLKPLASDNGVCGVFASWNALENGGCCASCVTIGW